jgi:hypothetical protein
MPKPSYPATLASTSLTSGIVGCWPLNEGSGNATDVVGGGVLNCAGSGVSWSSSPLGLITNGSPSRAFLATPSYLKLYPSSQPEITLLWYGTINGTLASDGGFGGVADSSGGGYEYSMGPNGSGQNGYGCNNHGYGGTASVVSPNTYQLVLQQNAGNLLGFVNGSGDGTTSNNAPAGITYAASSQVWLGSQAGTSASTNLTHMLFVVWNRVISSTELGEMNTNPWQIFAPARSGAALMSAM